MKNERDIIQDMKPIRTNIPPTHYFHHLAEMAIQHKGQFTRKRKFVILGSLVASIAACWFLIIWLLPNTESSLIEAKFVKTEAITTHPVFKNQKLDSNTLPVNPNKKRKEGASSTQISQTISESELDLSSLSEEEVLSYLEEEEIDLMELEEFVNSN